MAGRSAIGLDIGTSGVRAAQVAFGRGGITLQKFGQLALPDGAVRDGEVIDAPAVAKTIKQLWSATKFSSKNVVIGVANAKVVVRQVELPWLPADELRTSLAFQVQDYVPMPVDDALLDFHPLEEVQGEQGQRVLRGLLVAASRDMVNASVDAVQRAGLRPVMVDLSSFAVLRAMGQTDDLGMGAPVEALVDVGARVTNIVVHQGGVPRFVRILLQGGQDITDALARRLGMPYDEAEALKQRLTVDADSDAADTEAVAVVHSTGGQLVEEIRNSLGYFAAASPTGPASRLVLTGGGARLDGLAGRLSGVLGVPVTVGTPIERLRLGKTGLSPEQIEFVAPLAAVPVGLALGAA